jgi:hypothetical protein
MKPYYERKIMKNKLISTKRFVNRHRVAIAMTGTALACLYLNRLALEQHNDFLKENGLYDAFYNFES